MGLPENVQSPLPVLIVLPMTIDKPREECAIFGVLNAQDAAAHCVLGLHALQHRGQEASGIVSTTGKDFFQRTAFGRVGDQFNKGSVIDHLAGTAAIGHNRYSTSGSKQNYANIQPLFAELETGGLALAHNGNLTNARELRTSLVKRGCLFRTSMDTEVVIHLIAVSEEQTLHGRIVDALSQVEGAYSMVLLTDNSLIGVRDPYGVRPLVLGQMEDSWILASETCAFDIIGATFVRDIEPGEMVTITEAGVESTRPFAESPPSRFCIFEYVYFSRPDSFIQGQHVYDTRKRMGQELALAEKHIIDVVVPVPDSGVPAALGYAQELGCPFELGIIRNHYVGRTFIEPTDEIRHLGVKLKHNANRTVLKGKRVALVDDSIVRGTTLQKVAEMVRDAGAAEIHIRISCPEWMATCHYRVDTPKTSELLASTHAHNEMPAHFNVESVAFLDIDALYRAVGEEGRDAAAPQYCDACFTGEYPVLPEQADEPPVTVYTMDAATA